MSPQLAMALHKRGVAFDRSVGAHEPADQGSRCAVQRIRPGCQQFTTQALLARRAAASASRGVWSRVVAWIRSL